MRTASVICLVVATAAIAYFFLDRLLRPINAPGTPLDTPASPLLYGLPLVIAFVAAAIGAVFAFACLIVAWRTRRADRL